MEHSWFKLLLRAVGAYAMVIAIGRLIDTAWNLAYSMSAMTRVSGGAGASAYLTWYIPPLTVTAVQLALAVYLLRGAPGFVSWALRKAQGRCPACDYDVEGLSQATCPECGATLLKRPETPAPSAPAS